MKNNLKKYFGKRRFNSAIALGIFLIIGFSIFSFIFFNSSDEDIYLSPFPAPSQEEIDFLREKYSSVLNSNTDQGVDEEVIDEEICLEGQVKDPLTGVCYYLPDSVSCNSGQKIGDVDGDGAITNRDAVITSEIVISNIPAPLENCCIDVDGVGGITSADTQEIFLIALGQSESPGICEFQSKTLCNDTDGGLNYFERGLMSINGSFRSADYCGYGTDATKVQEYYCENGTIKNYLYDCAEVGGTCVEGACFKEEVIDEEEGIIELISLIQSWIVGEGSVSEVVEKIQKWILKEI